MKLLVTGAAGFLGTNLWNSLKSSYDLVGLDKYTYAANEDSRQKILYVDALDYGYIYKGDCAKIEDVTGLLKLKPDAVLHMACESHNDTSKLNPSIFYHTNVIGTQVVLEACRLAKVPRVYIVVTDEVLAHDIPRVFPEQGRRDRVSDYRRRDNGLCFYEVPEYDHISDTEYYCSSPYSSSKMCQEAVVHAYRKTYDMDIVIIRPTNIYGPYQHPEKLISLGISNALWDKPIEIYGKGEQWRDYTFVDDTVDAIDLILQQDSPELLYHISANDERQNLSVAQDIIYEVQNQLGNYPSIKFIEDPRGKSHDFSYSLSSQRIRKLGWKPKVNWKEGLARTVKWYRERTK